MSAIVVSIKIKEIITVSVAQPRRLVTTAFLALKGTKEGIVSISEAERKNL
jgi:hypothetical protein